MISRSGKSRREKNYYFKALPKAVSCILIALLRHTSPSPLPSHWCCLIQDPIKNSNKEILEKGSGSIVIKSESYLLSDKNMKKNNKKVNR